MMAIVFLLLHHVLELFAESWTILSIPSNVLEGLIFAMYAAAVLSIIFALISQYKAVRH